MAIAAGGGITVAVEFNRANESLKAHTYLAAKLQGIAACNLYNCNIIYKEKWGPLMWIVEGPSKNIYKELSVSVP